MTRLQIEVAELHTRIDRLSLQITNMFQTLSSTIIQGFYEVLAGIRELPSRMNQDEWRSVLDDIHDNDARWRLNGSSAAVQAEIRQAWHDLRRKANVLMNDTANLYLVATSMLYEAILADRLGEYNKPSMDERYRRYVHFFERCLSRQDSTSLEAKLDEANHRVRKWETWKNTLVGGGKKVYSDYDLGFQFGGSTYTICQLHSIDWESLESTFEYWFYDRRGPQPANGDPANYDPSLTQTTVATKILVHVLGANLKQYRLALALRDSLIAMIEDSLDYLQVATEKRATLPAATPAGIAGCRDNRRK